MLNASICKKKTGMKNIAFYYALYVTKIAYFTLYLFVNM